jgi:hypothetical protein
MLTEIVVSLVIVGSAILIYFLFFNTIPGAKLIVTPPPITTSNLDAQSSPLYVFLCSLVSSLS